MKIIERLKKGGASARDRNRILRLALKVANTSHPDRELKPVIFFNASTRLVGLSQNAAFAMLAAMGLQSAGVPVLYFACRSGVSHCVLSTDRQNPTQPPPCEKCIKQSQLLFTHAPLVWFDYQPDVLLRNALQDLDVQTLSSFEWEVGTTPAPLGPLVLPSVRWALRRHDLADDHNTRYLLREYILSAHQLALQFSNLLERVEPSAVVVFNGIMYPEATARWTAQNKGCRVITHEVGFTPFSVFLTDGMATRYPIDIPADFELSADQNQQLDVYLEQRFEGKFTMAGIQFWPQIRDLDEALLERISAFEQVAPVFTNVIYDTSQIGTNVLFESMFDWLDSLLPVIRAHPETFFIIRAHPDEMRDGKQSQQSVRMWFDKNEVASLPNTLFIGSRAYLNSYQLIQRSKFILVYNSSIGLEATLLGTPVLCAAAARYTQYPIVFFPHSREDYLQNLDAFLNSEQIDLPSAFVSNARRFLYYQHYRVSLPFERFLENSETPGYVRLKKFHPDQLHPDRSPSIKAILNGILEKEPFQLAD